MAKTIAKTKLYKKLKAAKLGKQEAARVAHSQSATTSAKGNHNQTMRRAI